ncbi:hypothetical protein BDY17DRAFT_290224 [Neohortaea acidophila]|uniref:Uncharacterized protein n=1 Tax=Neohortaea acidophila TaxID=245834 RepID=A0A6A6Q7Q2_9PEZI|nr:uncharacterized protein BDY17DRAFT_290224 [Neohortaea acidophila]KAF2488079.1 hypothetical protein BDY17DRAFT_290224 [Neohortaea acidophila]
MQTLWARVAQARASCHCPQCLPRANGIARRASAAASRRIPQYLTSSTLWYSGIFAAAATFDAAAKMRRREQWDQVISEMKQELKQPVTTTACHTTEAVVEDRLETESKELVYSSVEELDDEESDIFRDVEPQESKAFWPTNTGAALKKHHLAPESIFAPNERHAQVDKKTLTPKKVAEIQMALDMLQLEIFQELQRRGWSQKAANAVPADFARNIMLSSDELARHMSRKRAKRERLFLAEPSLSGFPSGLERLQLCNFTQDNASLSQQSVRDLNRTIRELFDMQAEQKLSKAALLGRLTYNLSSCSAPPNLKTFNTLLIGFTRIQEPAFTDMVIKRLRRAHMRPNEVTLNAVLRHYTRTNQAHEFALWLAYIRGKGEGLALARPDITITEAGRSRLVRQEHRPDKINQLPYGTPYVFRAVIEGVVKFAGFDAALSVCQRMGADGWGLCMEGFTPLLRDCAERADWRAGMAVWSQIQTLKASSRRRISGRLMTERIELPTFAAMLKLCMRCGQDQGFENVWKHAVRVHGDVEDRLLRLVKGGEEQNVRRAALQASGEVEETDATSPATPASMPSTMPQRSPRVEATPSLAREQIQEQHDDADVRESDFQESRSTLSGVDEQMQDRDDAEDVWDEAGAVQATEFTSPRTADYKYAGDRDDGKPRQVSCRPFAPFQPGAARLPFRPLVGDALVEYESRERSIVMA